MDDYEGDKEEPKDHSSRIADFSCVLGSESLKINHTNRLFGRVAQRTLLRANNKFKRLVFAKSHWNYDWNRVLWSDDPKIELWPCTPSACLASKEGCIQSTSYLASNMVVDH